MTRGCAFCLFLRIILTLHRRRSVTNNWRFWKHLSSFAPLTATLYHGRVQRGTVISGPNGGYTSRGSFRRFISPSRVPHPLRSAVGSVPSASVVTLFKACHGNTLAIRPHCGTSNLSLYHGCNSSRIPRPHSLYGKQPASLRNCR